MEWLILFISLIIYIICWNKHKKTKILLENNKKINDNNNKILKEQEELINKNKILCYEIANNKEKLEDLKKQQIDKYNEIEKISNDLTKNVKKSFIEYCNVLENNYKSKEKEYDNLINLLENSYNNKQDELITKIELIRSELTKISSTRAAAQEAAIREQDIKNNKIFYSLAIDDTDQKEINTILSISRYLRDDRPLKMLVWSNYYLKKANILCSRVLGTENKCGIYKITNTNTELAYIGQAKDIKERWRDHMKHGLGIDTPVGNKLYDAMKNDGLECFTFEILEECSSNLLDEKEKFYIDLYQTYDYGYNNNRGNGKNKYIDNK